MNTYEICFVQENLIDTVREGSPQAALIKSMRKLDDLAMRPQRGDHFQLQLSEKLTITILRTA